jgi:predicted nucleic acid-binding protein
VKEFFDTSVFVAALLEDHANHSESFALLAAANKEHTACGLHSLAEVYATMTALPSKAAVAPEQALFVVQELRKRCTVIALNEEEYLTTLEGVAKRGLRSGAIYDALLLALRRQVKR